VASAPRLSDGAAILSAAATSVLAFRAAPGSATGHLQKPGFEAD
jgi:hypothetical protein